METFPPASPDDDGAVSGDLDEQAVTWLVRLTSGEATASDRAAFAAWRAEDPAHDAALRRARQLWVSLGKVWPEVPASRRAWHLAPIPTVAALLVITLLAYQYLHVWRHDFVTAAGARQTIALSDGSKVELAGDSALDVHFENGARQVTLARGEVFFEVVHDEHHPFTVSTGVGEVRDIGTAFAVRLDGETMRVTVARGEVEVRQDDHTMHLTPNQRIAVAAAIGPIEIADAGEALAWTRGRLILEDKPLGTVIAELNRYSAQRIVLIGKAGGARHVSAVIDLDHADDWLNALHDSQGVKVARLPGLVLLY